MKMYKFRNSVMMNINIITASCLMSDRKNLVGFTAQSSLHCHSIHHKYCLSVNHKRCHSTNQIYCPSVSIPDILSFSIKITSTVFQYQNHKSPVLQYQNHKYCPSVSKSQEYCPSVNQKYSPSVIYKNFQQITNTVLSNALIHIVLQCIILGKLKSIFFYI